MGLASILLQLLASVIAIIVAARTLRMHLPGASGALKERLPSFDFLKGACIIMVVMTHARALPMPPSFLAGSLALFILISWTALSRLAPMPILYLFVPVAFSCILLNVHWIAMKLAPVLTKPFEALGRNTLAIYMVHWPLLLFALEPLIPGDVPAEMSFVILAVLAVIISYSFSLVFIPAYRSILARLGVYGGSGAI